MFTDVILPCVQSEYKHEGTVYYVYHFHLTLYSFYLSAEEIGRLL